VSSSLAIRLANTKNRRKINNRRVCLASQPVRILPHARARERVVPISELMFGTLTQNRSSLEPSLGFAAIAGTPRIENGGTFAVDFVDGTRDGTTLSSGMRPKILGSSLWTGGGTAVQPGAPQPFRVPLWLFKSLHVWYTIHNAGRPGNRGKSKRRLKTTPVLG
jgi:hypothetical protein